MQDSNIRNAVIREFVRLCSLNACFLALPCIPFAPTICIIYRGTSANSPARRLMVDMVVEFPSFRAAQVMRYSDPEFLYDVAHKALSQLNPSMNALGEICLPSFQAEKYLV